MSKIRYKKIRGKNKRLRHIQAWIDNNRILDIDLLKQNEREYVKFWVKPFCNLQLGNSVYPEPYGEYKNLLLKGLLEIYHHWQKQLDELNEPYYLKIWLYENKLSQSQVVCAVGNYLTYYDNVFMVAKNTNYQNLVNIFKDTSLDFKNIYWQAYTDYQFIENNYLQNQHYANKQERLDDELWFKHIQDTITEKYYPKNPQDGLLFYYLKEIDKVWIGGSSPL